jgi:hypothetical protein
MLVKLTNGVNFTNVVRAAFTSAEPKSIKRQSSHQSFYAFGIRAHKSGSQNVDEIDLRSCVMRVRSYLLQHKTYLAFRCGFCCCSSILSLLYFLPFPFTQVFWKQRFLKVKVNSKEKERVVYKISDKVLKHLSNYFLKAFFWQMVLHIIIVQIYLIN